MGVSTNVAPVIIKRKKIVKADGHHGGAWKVAYADFVTAMMAFFMLMWLLNATTEKQRKGIADYFSPTVPINRISGGGDAMFGGNSVFDENTLARNGTGGLPLEGTEAGQPGKEDAKVEIEDDDGFHLVEDLLIGNGGESLALDNVLKHVTLQLTDEGLVIEIFDLEDRPLFFKRSDTPTRLLIDLVRVVAESSQLVGSSIAVEGHVSSAPIVVANQKMWGLSAERANRVRSLLEVHGVNKSRLSRVTGHADREPKHRDPLSVRNNRIQVILLRE